MHYLLDKVSSDQIWGHQEKQVSINKIWLVKEPAMIIPKITKFDAFVPTTKSVLGRVRNCVGEQALRCEMVASSYVCQPNQSYADFHVTFTQ